MFKLLSTLVFAATAVHAIAIPRATAPSSYNTDLLEPYDTYNTRYLALDCEDKHDTSFFDDCCHPLLNTQSLSDRPSYCTPGSSSSAPAATSIAVVNAAAAPAVTASASSGEDADTHAGKATWFYQNGVAGACGTVHAETDKIIALDTALYGNTGVQSQYCGKSLIITNKSNGKTVTATVADACPTCESADSIDLSQGAFEALADLSVGEFDVEWHFTD
ncbi:hypothetical protein EIP86_004066 [Pleurotus ostreatoroseus]|nr:hypothetical protein EIP86_004066 [Pleurotus ostreatoroseus]